MTFCTTAILVANEHLLKENVRLKAEVAAAESREAALRKTTRNLLTLISDNTDNAELESIVRQGLEAIDTLATIATTKPSDYKPHARGDGLRFHTRIFNDGFQVYGLGLDHIADCPDAARATMVADALEAAANRVQAALDNSDSLSELTEDMDNEQGAKQ